VKILVVDDHPLILEALRQVLRQLDNEVEVHAAETAADARRLVAAHEDADLLLLDLNLPGVEGLSLLTELRTQYPAVPVVVVSASDQREDLIRVIDLGAMGFIPKSSANQVMLGALRLVLSGGVYLPPAALTALRPAPVPHPRPATAPDGRLSPRDLGLTDRQAQVLAQMLQGKPNKLISRELDLAESTVKIHVAAVLRALHVTSRTQAVIEASRLGLAVDALAFTSPPRATRG
jgi:DNA-binding NarL/FixJ family response regulator